MKSYPTYLFILLTLVSSLARGQGTFQYDQQISNTNAPGGYLNILPGPTGQSFVPSLSAVGFVELYLSDGSLNHAGTTLCVNLWSGSLTNGNLLGTSTPVFLPDNFLGVTHFPFSIAVTVTIGMTYYFQPLIQSGDSEQLGVVASSLYPNGTAYFQGAANSGFDLWFREGIVVPEPSSALLFFLGGGVVAWRHRKTRRDG
jgi:hypothetical protein